MFWSEHIIWQQVLVSKNYKYVEKELVATFKCVSGNASLNRAIKIKLVTGYLLL